MHFLTKNRFWIAAAAVIILGIGVLLMTFGFFTTTPKLTDFKSRYFSFEYPRVYATQEYASGEVSIGIQNGQILMPNIEVNRYQSDPDVAAPPSFDAFMKEQAAALCGADGPTESVTCTQVGVTPTTTPNGLSGQMLDLMLIRKNLATGTTTSSTYGPLYVFNTTATATPDSPLRYTAVFVYPALSAFLDGTTTPDLMQQVISTLTLPEGVSSVK